MSHDSEKPQSSVSRRHALKLIAAVPAIALTVAATGPAQAADNKKQFKYQDKPKNGRKCSSCRFFKAPHGCTIVTGKISPNGWCVAWAKK